jgi:hypothetical protein
MGFNAVGPIEETWMKFQHMQDALIWFLYPIPLALARVWGLPTPWWLKINLQGWRHGSSSRAPVLQAWSPGFQPQYYKQKLICTFFLHFSRYLFTDVCSLDS